MTPPKANGRDNVKVAQGDRSSPGGNSGSLLRKRINVALQGGGSHGAYTWGVLDRLLEDDRLEIEAISGTSAGAMNAVVMAEGLVEGGRVKARQQLADFWEAVSVEALSSPIHRSIFDVMNSSWSLDFNPALAMMDMMTRVVSPYQFNPLNINPLKQLLLREVDFDRVHACRSMRLFISATNVHTGQARVFTGRDVTVEAVLASACLPFMFQAVEIDGEPYWDGGYTGNPVLSPFFETCLSQDLLLVQINPIERRTTPTTAREIMDRVSEVSFNAPLLRELGHIEFINECLRRGELFGRGYREVFVHRIGGGDELVPFSASSKMNGDREFLLMLRDLGRKSASDWLATNFDKLGVVSTMPIGSPLHSTANKRSAERDRLPAARRPIL
jgi:NTE family protein